MGKPDTFDAASPHPRIVRYHELRPCFDAFIDTRSPGSDRKENFTIIGPGVSENPNQYVHIAEPHGFNIGGARQPPGCVNSQHSHDTAEVFYVHSGTWSFNLGERGEDAKITLREGDLISIPTQLFRGFENIGDDIGYLWAVLGKDNPGKVLWAPDVFDMAKNYGLVLLESGLLIDTSKGETIPEGAKIMPITSSEQIAGLSQFSAAMLKECCVFSDETMHTNISGAVRRRELIGPQTNLNWDHGFRMDHLTLMTSGATDAEIVTTPEVVFVHHGQLQVKVGREEWTLGPGDTATLPRSLARQYLNPHTQTVEFLRVRGDA